MKRVILRAALSFFLLCQTACYRSEPRLSANQALPVPTKDEVVLVDGRRLSLTGYLAIRAQLGSEISTESALWVAVGAMVLQNETRARGSEISTATALLLSRYAAGQLPSSLVTQALDEYSGSSGRRISASEMRSTIESIMKRSVIRRNMQALAEVDRTVTKR